MSGFSLLKRATRFCISFASAPSTGTGKKKSILSAAAATVVAMAVTVAASAIDLKSLMLALLFDAGEQEGTDELALEQREGDEERSRDEQRRRRDEAPIGCLLGRANEGGEADGQHHLAGTVGDHQRPEKLVPMRGHGDDREGDEAGPRQGHEHEPDHLGEAR